MASIELNYLKKTTVKIRYVKIILKKNITLQRMFGSALFNMSKLRDLYLFQCAQTCKTVQPNFLHLKQNKLCDFICQNNLISFFSYLSCTSALKLRNSRVNSRSLSTPTAIWNEDMPPSCSLNKWFGSAPLFNKNWHSLFVKIILNKWY